ncbi:hypothetical protein IG631_23907 [Alternaria alternata]|nr:hypothetical protein IG631_23907 [Alternaria alternata]
MSWVFSCFPANSKAAASTKDRATVEACVDQIGVVQSATGAGLSLSSRATIGAKPGRDPRN